MSDMTMNEDMVPKVTVESLSKWATNELVRRLCRNWLNLNTRVMELDGDLYSFKQKTDYEVRQCPSFSECISNSGMGIGSIEDMEQWACGGKAWHECSCRPIWYLQKMREEE